MPKFNVTVERMVKEEYQMTLQTDTAMQALDQAREMAKARNKTSLSGHYSIIKVEEEK